MASIRVTHTIDDLASDMRKIATSTKPTMARIVRRNVSQGEKVAQGIAKRASGPHGKAYWKRITSEMVSPLEGEYGPHGDVVGNAVGAGWRHGPPNTDLEKSLDIIGPRFAREVSDAADSLFWPES